MFFAWLLVKLIAPSIRLKQSDQGCEYVEDENTILFDKNTDPEGHQYFIDHIRKKHYFENPEKYSEQLWSLLHEIGHYKTQDYVEVDIETLSKVDQILKVKEYSSKSKIKRAYFMYYNTECEYEATEWAIDWIVHHKVLARIFSNLLK